MCPGGIICPSMTAPDEVVVNGWSPSSRSSRWANAGIVVETAADGDDVLAGIGLQAAIERAAAAAGGGEAVAPAQRLVDFVEGRLSRDLPACSYVPGVRAADLAAVLPGAAIEALRAAVVRFGRTMRGWLTNDAVAVGVETRTSAPVRIPRDATTCMHPDASGLFPCGEGAGAAGGIVSAAWMAPARGAVAGDAAVLLTRLNARTCASPGTGRSAPRHETSGKGACLSVLTQCPPGERCPALGSASWRRS
jgi:uncharacterized FAD-dependent dehydrogenase